MTDLALHMTQTLVWPLFVLVVLIVFRRPLSVFLEDLGGRISKVSVYQFTLELAPTKQEIPVPEKFGNLAGESFTSDPTDLLNLFAPNAAATDYAVFDLGDGRRWLTSRLFVFATMLERMRGLRCCLFVESGGLAGMVFIGTAEPGAVRWALARSYPWLEPAFAEVYTHTIVQASTVSTEPVPNAGTPDRDRTQKSAIHSARGALSVQHAKEVVLGFLKHGSIFLKTEPPPAETKEWVPLGQENSRDHEHACWLDARLLAHALDGVLYREAIRTSATGGDRSKGETERINRKVLRSAGNFVALTDRRGSFLQLVERQDLLERWAEQIE